MKNSIYTSLLILSIFFSLSQERLNTEPFESPFYMYRMSIGKESDEEVSLLIDPSKESTYLFNNTGKNFNNNLKPQNETMTTNIKFNNMRYPNYTFNLMPIPRGYDPSEIDGILGIGISIKDKKNIFMDELSKNKAIAKKKLFFDVALENYLKFYSDQSEKEIEDITYCKLTDREDLEEKYQNGWLCEFSHVVQERKLSKDLQKKNKGTSEDKEDKENNQNIIEQITTWDDTIEINGRAYFDINSNFIKAPGYYSNVIMDFYNLSDTECHTQVNTDLNANIIYCNFKNPEEKIKSLNNLYFMFDGYAYKIPIESIFIPYDGNYICTIIFSNEEKNIWSFGLPLFENYKIEFNFDSLQVGLKGTNKPLNLTTEYNQWIKDNEEFLSKHDNDKKIMIIGIVSGALMLLIVLIVIIRTLIRDRDPSIHSKFIEENPGGMRGIGGGIENEQNI